MSGFGPRTYLVGQILPLMLTRHPGGGDSTAESLDEVIRITLYIVDLTMARMGRKITHDFEESNAKPAEDPTI